MSEQETPTLPVFVAELNALKARQAELEAAVLAAKKDSLPVIAQNVLTYIADNGFSLDEILPLLKKGKGKGKAKADQPRVTFTSKVNPANVYVRGVLPAWLKEEMVAAGFDPESKESRDTYKTEHMVRAA